MATDTAIAVGVLALTLPTLFGEETRATPGEVVATVLLVAPLALRRTAPVAAFAAVMLACGAELVLSERFLAANVAVLIALYTLVAFAPRRVAAAGVAVAFAGTIPFALHFDEFADEDRVVVVAVLAVHLLLAAVLGDYRRVALRERAAGLEHREALAAARERERIARELHDIVGHALAVVITQADGGRYGARGDPAAAPAALETIAATARQALAETRRTVGALGEAPREPVPGAGELQALVDRTRDAGLVVELAEHGRPPALSAGEGLTVYRVVQEALTNVLKHAGRGAHATVALQWADDAVRLVVRDDGGDGATTAAPPGDGRGLSGMRTRVEPHGGTLSAGPQPDGGYELRATIPLGGDA
jgi:signal transduction histidine kinase